jgi:predicted NUDIX family phosphoesterase
MKGHVFFNTWCTCTMLAELLENIETETDVIIKDRGLFDSMVWLQLQHRRGEVTDDEVRRIEDFVLLERWRSLVDIVVLCKVSPEQALERESAPRILPKVGSIMNPEVLMGFNEAAEEAEGKYSSFFRKFISKDTTGASPKDTGIELAEQILGTLESFLDPEILAVPREVVQSLPLNSGGCFESSDVGAAIDTMRGAQQYVKRSQAEDSDTLVQLVPCAVLVHREKIFTFQRKEEDPKYRLYGKTTIWQGCHVTRNPTASYEQHLQRRLAESLFLSRPFPARILGYTWDKDEENSRKHLGLTYRVDVTSDIAADLENKEFRKGRGFGLSGKFWPPSELIARKAEFKLESWSRTALDTFARVGL